MTYSGKNFALMTYFIKGEFWAKAVLVEHSSVELLCSSPTSYEDVWARILIQ